MDVNGKLIPLVRIKSKVMAAGVYFVQLTTNGEVITKKACDRVIEDYSYFLYPRLKDKMIDES